MPKYKNKDSEILQRLGEWKQKDGKLPQFIEVYQQLLHLQIELRSGLIVPDPNLTEETAIDQLREGLPLLKFDDLLLDWDLVQNQFRAVIDILVKYLPDRLEEAQGLKKLATDIPLLQQVVRDWYQGLSLSSIAAEQHIGDEFLIATIQTTLRPFLVAHSEVLLKLVNQEIWRRRYCPVCGGIPDFAFLDKERGARWLLCSRCDAEWLFQRLQCPYCGTQKQDSLAYFTDEKEQYRLYICRECHHYIKAIDLRKTQSEVLLPLERITTLDLDRQAEEAGYGSW